MADFRIDTLRVVADRVATDLRDAARGLRLGRGTTAVAFAVLTLTMAAGTITFSVVDGVAIRTLPYASPDRLVAISFPSPVPGRGMPASPQAFFAWRESTETLESIAAARVAPPLQIEIDGVLETFTARAVTANLFDVLGVRPMVGRSFASDHERHGGPGPIVLSDDVWRRKFQSDPGVVGRSLTSASGPREVIGILPAGVAYPITLADPPDLYVPYAPTAVERAMTGTSLFVVGRLRAGATVEQALADLERIAAALVHRLHDSVVGPAKGWLFLVLAAVGLVLLVAWVNVGSLILARATVRAPEFAARSALGASPARLAWVQLLEGAMLALAAAATAVVVSMWGVEIAKSILPRGLTRVPEVGIDARVLAFATAASLLCAMIFGAAPAWFAARRDAASLIKAGGAQVVGGGRRDRALSAFLVADVAFVCILLVGTTLVVASYRFITTADLGFDRRHVMSIWFQRSFAGVAVRDQPAALAAFHADLLHRARSVPGVAEAAVSDGAAPLSNTRRHTRILVRDHVDLTPHEIEMRAVTPGYFSVMSMQLLRGRLFENRDRQGAPVVMLVNEMAARRLFADGDDLGRVVTWRGEAATIVGVLKDVHSSGPESEVRPEVILPLAQLPARALVEPGRDVTPGALLVRTTRDPRAVADAVREAIRPALGAIEPQETHFVQEYFDRLTAHRRFNARLMGMFGLVAVVMGALGIYGTTAFVVARQVRSIGLRIALGASPGRVMRSVLSQALRLILYGATIGIAGAWAGSSVFRSFVFGLEPTAPAVYLGVAAFLGVVGFFAALAPALRAARLDPIDALRCE
jgi:putative ABC transport system permease protein